ncbi:MAG: CPBP family intramembrane metalloprotease [Actinomycetota bacterium]|nr:CPBP family intramembrane metalloprotease [Actinomycetota bacterium]
MEASTQNLPPPDPPELPAGAARFPAWPTWFAPVGFLVALSGTLLFGLVLGLVATLFGADVEGDSPAVVIVGTLAQGVAFVATALFFASRVCKPRAWHFGLRGTGFWPALGWAALGMASFYFVTAIYGALVQPDAEQETVEALGGDDGTFGLIIAGLMVIAVAPVVEEIFFRGFFYRALRSRLSIAVAAGIDGLLFGLIHYSGDGVDGLLILPPLALLGVAFCLVYERTGSLFPVIGMHAFNNALAYAVQADDGWQVSVVAGPLVLGACALVPRLLPAAPRPAPA